MATQPESIAFWGRYSGSVPAPTNADQQGDPSAYQGYDEDGVVDPNYEDQNKNPWDTAKIGGIVVPGIVRIDLKKEMTRDKKKAVGNQHASITLTGFDMAEVIMSVKMWTEEQFSRYIYLVGQIQKQLLEAFKAPPNTVLQDPTQNGIIITGSATATLAASAVTVDHPALQVFGIKDLYVRQMVPPVPTGTPGVMEAKFIFEEFRIVTQGKPNTVRSAKSKYPPTALQKTTKQQQDDLDLLVPVPPERTGATNP